MGTLTDDMTRLCGEIGSMRRARLAITKDRRAAVSQMQAGFADAHREMARQSKASRRAFVSSLKRAVAGKRRDLRDDLASLKRAVAGKRREIRDDLAGARRAWLGSVPAQLKVMGFEKRRSAEGEASAPEKEQAAAQPATRSKHQGKGPKPNRA